MNPFKVGSSGMNGKGKEVNSSNSNPERPTYMSMVEQMRKEFEERVERGMRLELERFRNVVEESFMGKLEEERKEREASHQRIQHKLNVLAEGIALLRPREGRITRARAQAGAGSVAFMAQFPCMKCGKRFHYQALLKLHMKTEHKSQVRRCTPASRGTVEHGGSFCLATISSGDEMIVLDGQVLNVQDEIPMLNEDSIQDEGEEEEQSSSNNLPPVEDMSHETFESQRELRSGKRRGV